MTTQAQIDGFQGILARYIWDDSLHTIEIVARSLDAARDLGYDHLNPIECNLVASVPDSIEAMPELVAFEPVTAIRKFEEL